VTPPSAIGRGNRLRRAAAIGVAAVAAVAGALWVVSTYTELLASVVSVDAERRWTAAIWEDVRAATPVDRRDDTRRLVDLAARLAAQWPENPYGELRVSVIAEESGNAWALPGGVVLVTTGLLDVVPSENAMAYVLAHEIGHLHGGDHLRVLDRRLAMALLLDAAGWQSADLGDFLLGAGLLTRREHTLAEEEAADRFALGVLQAEYGHVGGPDALLEAVSNRGWPSDHLVASPRRAGMRAASLRSIARDEGWPETGPLRPWPAADESAAVSGAGAADVVRSANSE
jgi:Zn-dependent protease with chaperone function